MKKRILLVEDEPFIFGAYIKMLREKGYVVDIAKNVSEAVTLLSDKCYELLILDIMLPHGDELPKAVSPKKSGMTLVSLVRKGKVGETDVSKNANVALIVLTAISDYPSLQEIKTLKPHIILKKPVVYRDFFAAIKDTLGKSVLDEAE